MLNNKIADEVWLTGGVANLAIYLSMGAGAGLVLGAGIDAYLKKGRKDRKVKKSNTN